MSQGSQPKHDPVAIPQNVVVSGNARFTVFNGGSIRMEWSPDGIFEDRPSQVFLNRKMPAIDFDQQEYEGELTIRIPTFSLFYKQPSERFSKDNLRIRISIGGYMTDWSPGVECLDNLGGTIRTLDGVSGATNLDPGLMSRAGWVLVDDSNKPVWDDSDPARLIPREREEAIDWYFFAFLRHYPTALQQYTQLSGAIPLPPRYAFGAWWSRYWPYTDAELRHLVGEFKEHDVPLDVLVLDMDWHLDGWTGYTWNPEYFPDPEGFLGWAHDEGLRVALNLHPADGVGKHEKAFPEFARSMGLDPDKTERIPFDCTDPKFMDSYFKLLHHPLEAQGVDFWWLDWQQGTESEIPGVDPLWYLNHQHWTDMERRAEETGKRPMLLSRWGGLGSHRYQVGFSGDTYCNWQSLAFQPYATATAANVGNTYWSHDIGGHMPGPVEPELYARWIQSGVVSPIFRTHATKDPRAERRIWEFPDDVFQAARKAIHLRYELLPYIYSAARQTYQVSWPICRPLYYEWNKLDAAYQHESEYLFGSQMLAAPVTEPMNPDSRRAQVRLWIPPGKWADWFTGRIYEGPGEHRLLVPLDEIPLLVRPGGIVTTSPRGRNTKETATKPLMINIFPGDDDRPKRAWIYDDDGISIGYQGTEFTWTTVMNLRRENNRYVTIGPVEGSFPGMATQRDFEVRLHDVWPVEAVMVNDQPFERAAKHGETGWRYDGRTMSVVVKLPPRPLEQQTNIMIKPYAALGEEELLPNGLRHRVMLLEEITEMINGEPSDAGRRLAAALETRQPLEKYRQAIAVFEKQWDGLPSAIGKAAANADVKRRALTLWLGLYYKAELYAGAKEDDPLEVFIEVAPLFAKDQLQGVQAEVKLQVSAPWRIKDQSQWRAGELSASTPLVKQTLITSDDPMQTGVLKAEVTVKVGEFKLELPIEQVFLPSINAWWVVGPFDEAGAAAGGASRPSPEKIDLRTEFKDKDGKTISWSRVARGIAPGADLTSELFVDFDDLFGGGQGSVAYALCYLHAAEATEATLAMGSAGKMTTWLNGGQIHSHGEQRLYTPKEDQVRVTLQKGQNTLLLEVGRGDGDWGFCVHVEDKEGKPVPGIRVGLAQGSEEG